MKINDRVYGDEQICDEVLVELIKSPPIQRLKGVSQFGVPDKYYSHKGFSRFEHSIGVMIFLKRLDAPLEEQISGLLHDVSVTAFSHISDWVFGSGQSGDEGYHDTLHEKFILRTEIPAILSEYGFDLGNILDDSRHPLQENHIPDICADRIDYSLREFSRWYDPKRIPMILDSMIKRDDKIVFNNTASALSFSNGFLELNRKNWSGIESVYRYHLFSQMLKRAIEIGLIHEEDFYKSEDEILSKIEGSTDSQIRDLIELLSMGSDITNTINNKNGEVVMKKFRYVDPFVLIDNETKRLSEIDQDFANRIEEERIIQDRGFVF